MSFGWILILGKDTLGESTVVKQLKDKISFLCTFKGTQNRVPLYKKIFSLKGEMFPDNTDVFICDASEPSFYEKNRDIIFESFKKQRIHYFKEQTKFLKSWLFLIKKIETPYVMAFFDDQLVFNLNDNFFEKSINFIEKNDLLVLRFNHYMATNVDTKLKHVILKFDEEQKKDLLENLISTEQDDFQFGVINNENARFAYSFFANNAIYKKSILEEQLEHYCNKFSHARSDVHAAELDHPNCPESLKYNRIGVIMNYGLGYIDLDYEHILGLRPHTHNRYVFECINNGYKLNFEV